MEPILEEEGIPTDFKYLAVIESGLSRWSVLRGRRFWQFMKRTAPEYGLEVSGTVDERYHVEKATRAACAYLREAHDRFGSWVLAAASYNMGQSGVAKSLENQHVDTYWDLHLNSETGRYVYRLLALREVMEAPGPTDFIWAEGTCTSHWTAAKSTSKPLFPTLLNLPLNKARPSAN